MANILNLVGTHTRSKHMAILLQLTKIQYHIPTSVAVDKIHGRRAARCGAKQQCSNYMCVCVSVYNDS